MTSKPESGASTAEAGPSGLKRKRAFSDEDEPQPKRFLYVLASESDLNANNSETESVWSIQDKSTDIVKTPADISSSSLGNSSKLENSISENLLNSTQIKDSSSSPGEMKPLATCSPKEIVNIRPKNNEKDVKKWTFKYCQMCKKINSDISYRFCQKCFSMRKTLLPPRPAKGGKKRIASLARRLVAADSGLGSSHSQSFLDFSGEDKAPEPSSGLCQICFLSPKNGGFSHGKTIHVYSCYKCSVKAFKQSGRCPICNIKVNQIFKIVDS